MRAAEFFAPPLQCRTKLNLFLYIFFFAIYCSCVCTVVWSNIYRVERNYISVVEYLIVVFLKSVCYIYLFFMSDLAKCVVFVCLFFPPPSSGHKTECGSPQLVIQLLALVVKCVLLPRGLLV